MVFFHVCTYFSTLYAIFEGQKLHNSVLIFIDNITTNNYIDWVKHVIERI